jgi:NAD(P)-dependent dehydrogenase (short-subunit alcohol dehydrogenase family)
MGESHATLSGRSVLVIGGSSGIGREIARQARAQGAELTITGRGPHRLATVGEELGGVKVVQLDAHDETALSQFFTGIDPVDHLVSMVGDSMAGGFLSVPPETMRHVLQSKFWTNWMIGRQAPNVLLTGGSLTFTSGTGGRAQDASATYVANLGLGALVEGLAFELSPERRVNAVAPTFMGAHTGFWRDLPSDELDQAAERVQPTGGAQTSRHR